MILELVDSLCHCRSAVHRIERPGAREHGRKISIAAIIDVNYALTYASLVWQRQAFEELEPPGGTEKGAQAEAEEGTRPETKTKTKNSFLLLASSSPSPSPFVVRLHFLRLLTSVRL